MTPIEEISIETEDRRLIKIVIEKDLIRRAKDAAANERDAWKDLARIGAAVGGLQIEKKIADKLLREVEDQHKDSPPPEKVDFKVDGYMKIDVNTLELDS